MNSKKLNDAVILFCDSASGRYIPQRFAAEIMPQYLTGVSQDQINDLADPDNEWYWQTWHDVLNNAKVVDHTTGQTYTLWHDGDLWLLDWDNMTPEEKLNFDPEYDQFD
jgi:hypothetical protein